MHILPAAVVAGLLIVVVLFFVGILWEKWNKDRCKTCRRRMVVEHVPIERTEGKEYIEPGEAYVVMHDQYLIRTTCEHCGHVAEQEKSWLETIDLFSIE